MTKYLFIESRDPFEARDTQFVEQTATALKQRGHSVTVFLVQNGVLASRRTILESSLSRMARAGVSLLADDFSLCERGIQPAAKRRHLVAPCERGGQKSLLELERQRCDTLREAQSGCRPSMIFS